MNTLIKIPTSNNIEKYIESTGLKPGVTIEELKTEINKFLENYKPLKSKLISILNKSKKILLYGDYDVDGCGAVTIMYKFLKALGKDVEVVIPNRSDGYGINQELFDKDKYDTCIFCDCGISDVNNLKQIKNKNNNVIVIDHHTENPEVNNYVDVLFKPKDLNISTGGLCYLFTELLNQEFKKLYEPLAPYACLTQISDMMELKDIGYYIARLGYLQLEKNKNTKTILNKLLFNKNFTSEDLAFSVIPVLNAASRMTEDSKMLFEVLNNPTQENLNILKEANKQRKELQSSIVKDVQNIIETANSSGNQESDKVIIQDKDDKLTIAIKKPNSKNNLISSVKQYLENSKLILVIQTRKSIILVDNTGQIQHGLLGPVCNELLSKFNISSFVISKVNGTYAGSSRSNSVSIYDILKETKDILGDRWGGHSAAAGFSVKSEDLIPFLEKLVEVTEKVEEQESRIEIATFNYTELTDEDIKLLNELEPFDSFTRPTLGFCGVILNKQDINDKLTRATVLLKGNGTKPIMLYNSQKNIAVNKFYAFLTTKLSKNDNSPIFLRDFSEHFKFVEIESNLKKLNIKVK